MATATTTPAESSDTTERLKLEHAPGGGRDPGGHVFMSKDVVATIAGFVARNVPGIHQLGKPRFVSFGDSPMRGIDAEVGEREAAIDIDAVIDYGCDLRQTAETLRTMVADEVNRMAGRTVIEVNIHVVDIHLPERQAPSPERRVQ